MKLFLTILHLANTLHLDEQHGILFIKDKPIYRHERIEKLYLSIMVRSPRELLNIGKLNFPDTNICYTQMDKNQAIIKKETCEKYLDQFDEEIYKIVKPDETKTTENKNIQKREVLTGIAFGVSVAVTAIFSYFIGKAHTESEVDVISAEMENERTRMMNLTRAADITGISLESLAAEFRENGDVATTVNPYPHVMRLIGASINFNGYTEHNEDGPWWLTKLVKDEIYYFQREHENLIRGTTPIGRSYETYKNTIIAKCIAAQKITETEAKKFCEQFGETTTTSMKYYGVSITKNENNKIKEIIFSSSVNIPILENETYENYQIINLGTYKNGIRTKLNVPTTIATNGLKTDSYNRHYCTENGNFLTCPLNAMIPEDDCLGNIFNENKFHSCTVTNRKTQKTCSMWENDQILFISMSEDIKITKTQKINKIEIIPKTKTLQFQCPNSRRQIKIIPDLIEKTEIFVNKLNSTTPIHKPENKLENKLKELHSIIKATNKTEEFHQELLNKTMHHFKEDVVKTAGTIPEVVENQLKAILMLTLPYLVTAAVIICVTMIACCILPCILRKIRSTIVTNVTAYTPDDSRRESQSV